jgi:hypothetical protein
MNKKLFTIIFSIIGLMAFSMPAFAATSITFSPTTVNVVEGKTFNVAVTANPGGVANYTTKLVLNYPADLVEVTAFNFNEAWMALSQAGYSSVDNTNGVLIKTGGYPGGYSSAVALGTVTFTAKKAGTGSVTISDKTVSYDVSSANTFTGSTSAVVFKVTAKTTTPVVTPTKPITTETKPTTTVTTPEETVTTPEETVVTPEETVTVPEEEAVEEVPSAQASFLSALSSLTGKISSFLSTTITLAWAIIATIIGFILGYVVRLIIEKRKKDKE